MILNLLKYQNFIDQKIIEFELKKNNIDKKLIDEVIIFKNIKIEDNSFKNFVKLKNIQNIKFASYIGSEVFMNCISLESIDIRNANEIGKSCFENCININNIIIKTNICLSEKCFANCIKLNNIKNLNYIMSFEEDTFFNCNLIKMCSKVKNRMIKKNQKNDKIIKDNNLNNINNINHINFNIQQNLNKNIINNIKNSIFHVNEKYLVSIIIPTYNREWSIKRCIDSILNQTYQNIEIIIIDDNSIDKTKDIINNYQNNNKNIKYIKNQKNFGAAISRNIGLDSSSGEYIYFLDSDDYIEPNGIEIFFKQIINTNSDICLCKIYYDKNKQKQINNNSLKIQNILENPFSINSININIFNISYPGLQNKFFKKEFLLKNNIKFQDLTSTNDILFCYKALILAKNITYIDQSLMTFVQHDKPRITSIKNNTWNNSIIAYKSVLDFFKTIKSKEQYNYNDFYENCILRGLYYNYTLLTDVNQIQKFRKKVTEVFGNEIPISSFLDKKKYLKLFIDFNNLYNHD